MDWASIDAALTWLSAKGPLMTGIAAIVVAIVAVLSYRKWHPESIGKRKIELAEDMLSDFYKAKDVIKWARFFGGFSGEGESRPSKEYEDPDEKSRKDSYYRTIERLQAENDLFTGLQSRRYRAMAYFGNEAAKPFNELKMIHNRIINAASMLIRTYQKDQPPPELWDEWETIIGWRSMADDETEREVDKIIETVEKFYGRWLMR